MPWAIAEVRGRPHTRWVVAQIRGRSLQPSAAAVLFRWRMPGVPLAHWPAASVSRPTPCPGQSRRSGDARTRAGWLRRSGDASCSRMRQQYFPLANAGSTAGPLACGERLPVHAMPWAVAEVRDRPHTRWVLPQIRRRSLQPSAAAVLFRSFSGVPLAHWPAASVSRPTPCPGQSRKSGDARARAGWLRKSGDARCSRMRQQYFSGVPLAHWPAASVSRPTPCPGPSRRSGDARTRAGWLRRSGDAGCSRMRQQYFSGVPLAHWPAASVSWPTPCPGPSRRSGDARTRAGWLRRSGDARCSRMRQQYFPIPRPSLARVRGTAGPLACGERSLIHAMPWAVAEVRGRPHTRWVVAQIRRRSLQPNAAAVLSAGECREYRWPIGLRRASPDPRKHLVWIDFPLAKMPGIA